MLLQSFLWIWFHLTSVKSSWRELRWGLTRRSLVRLWISFYGRWWSCCFISVSKTKTATVISFSFAVSSLWLRAFLFLFLFNWLFVGLILQTWCIKRASWQGLRCILVVRLTLGNTWTFSEHGWTRSRYRCTLRQRCRFAAHLVTTDETFRLFTLLRFEW